jgi:hypothetical protein
MRLLEPLKLWMFGAIEMHLLHDRPNYVEIASRQLAGLPESLALQLLDIATKRNSEQLHFVPVAELDEYLGTTDGLSLSIWLMTRRTEGQWSYDSVRELIESEEKASRLSQLCRLVRLVSSLDDAADRDWLSLSEAGDKEVRRQNWRWLIRKFCEAYLGMTPTDVGQLTLYQVRLLSSSEGNVKGLRMSTAEFRRRQAAGELDDAAIRWVSKKGA